MSSGLIPCNEMNLKVYYSNVKSLVPSWRKSEEGNVLQANGELYDPWFAEAERLIVRDLKKFDPPATISTFSNAGDLTALKVYKTLHLLFRSAFKEGEDKFKIEADAYDAQYVEEFNALPVITADGANASLGGSVTRRS